MDYFSPLGWMMSRIDNMTAYHLAIELVKKAGFTLQTVSRSSISCYYTHPSRPGFLMRLSTHKSKGSPIGMENVLSRVSFSRKDMYLTPSEVENRIKWAIGNYFLSDPKESKYKGPRGTWGQPKPPLPDPTSDSLQSD